ncbi:MAG: hypothetical protein HY671_00915 [Chloroflexi bacterium]|nr:hypothetical protein [Chloroflexota bacterium]
MDVLEIYVARHCFGSDEASRLAAAMQSLSGLQVKVRILDQLTENDMPEVVATPSYFLNGCLLFLGNPRLEELVEKVASLSRHKADSHE